MTSNPSPYRASGRVGAGAPIRVLLIGIPIALICAAIYAVVIRYNPFVYFSFLATTAFGVALGIAAVSAAQAGKSRSLAFDLAAALLIALLGLWAQWLIWLTLHDGGTPMALDLASKGPSGWAAFFNQLAENYHLSIGRAGRSSSAGMESGSMLWLWRVEALLVILSALFGAWSSSRDRVFCESTGRWAEKEGQVALDADSVQPAALLEAINRGDYSILSTLKPAPLPSTDEHRNIFLVTLIRESTSEDCRLMEIESGEDTLDAKGKLKRSRKSLLPKYFVPTDIYTLLSGMLTAKPVSPSAGKPQIDHP